jgi:hypothetical protein
MTEPTWLTLRRPRVRVTTWDMYAQRHRVAIITACLTVCTVSAAIAVACVVALMGGGR